MHSTTATGISFGARVKEQRVLAGLSQEALAIAAQINKETVYRIERGADTRATTIGKLRRVLPGLSAAQEVPPAGKDGMADEFDGMVNKIKHLISAFQTKEQLHRIRTYALQLLAEEQGATPSPQYLAEMAGRQDSAEARLIAKGTQQRATKKKSSSKRANGKAHT